MSEKQRPKSVRDLLEEGRIGDVVKILLADDPYKPTPYNLYATPPPINTQRRVYGKSSGGQTVNRRKK